MRWKGRRQSSNVDDRRGEAPPRGSGRSMNLAGGMGIMKVLFALFSKGSGKTKMLLILGVAVLVLVFNFGGFRDKLLGGIGAPAQTESSNNRSSGGSVLTPKNQKNRTPGKAQQDEDGKFLGAVLAANEDHWKKLLPKYGIRYRDPRLVIYNVGTRMPGGVADARMGPFYLPSNEHIYIDPTFFDEMETKFGVEGDFARAYVVAHEFGHHIQKILGRTTELHNKHGKVSKREYNRGSVRLELHADFLAGVFAHHDDKNFNSLDRGDIQEAMECARAIGDDRLQKQAGGRVRPDHFTHGTSEQRARWFMKGYTTGDLRVGEQIYNMDYDDL